MQRKLKRRAVALMLGSGLALALLPGAAHATTNPVTKSATLGKVAATVSYTTDSDGDVTSEQLKITRDGVTAYNSSVTSPDCGGLCENFEGVKVVRLQQPGEPDVILDQYTGGAHCCTVAQVYSYRARTGTYKLVAHNFGDPGYTITKLAGKDVFLTADDSFAYEFTDYAGSAMPVQILSFTGARFVNVTRSHPALIRADAAVWMKQFRQFAHLGYSDSVGVAAAWAADEELLGNSALVRSFLDRQARLGHLNSAEPELGPSGTRFVKLLYRVLRRDGYMK